MNAIDAFEGEFDKRFRDLLGHGDWDGLDALVAPILAKFVSATTNGRVIGSNGVAFDDLMVRLDRHPGIAHPTIGDGWFVCRRASDGVPTHPLTRLVLILAVTASDFLSHEGRSAINLVLTVCANLAREELDAGLDRSLQQGRLDPLAHRAALALTPKDRLRLGLRRHDFSTVDRDGKYTTWMLSYEELALIFGMKVKGADVTDLMVQAADAARQAHLRATRAFWANYRQLGG